MATNLCLADLAQMTGGTLHFASMPPLAGDLTHIGAIVLEPRRCTQGSLYWDLTSAPGSAEQAFLRGAAGIVSALPVPPWPGRYCLQVADPIGALRRFLAALEAATSPSPATPVTPGESDFSSAAPELKDLQLWSPPRVDIYPSTCERQPHGLLAHRCHRRAA